MFVPRRRVMRKGKKMAKKAGRRPRRVFKKSNVQMAHLTQTLQLGDDVTGTINTINNINLAQFDRATLVAQAYQFYRIKLVEIKWKPYYDTFANPDPTQPSGSVPYLYWLIDKGDTLDPSSFNMMRDSGSKPIRFDEKTITVRWRPSVLQYSLSSTDLTTAPSFNVSRTSPWLSTNLAAGSSPTSWTVSDLRHNGIAYGVEQNITGTPGFAYGAELTVHFEFKKPLAYKGADNKPVPVNEKLIG